MATLSSHLIGYTFAGLKRSDTSSSAIFRNSEHYFATRSIFEIHTIYATIDEDNGVIFFSDKGITL